MRRKLVIGGSGFIGSTITSYLYDKGEEITVLDKKELELPKRRNRAADIRFVKGNLKSDRKLEESLENVSDVLIHSGKTGIGRSIEEPYSFYESNIFVLKKLLKKINERNVENVILASTARVYGEGKYECCECGVKYPGKRTKKQLDNKQWEHLCGCGKELSALPSQEKDPKKPFTPYARSKLFQERFFQDVLTEANLVTLRYPFVYGPKQKGASKYFFDKVLNSEPPKLFEDGMQTKDFVHVEDIAKVNYAALDLKEDVVLNVGKGRSEPLKQFINTIVQESENSFDPKITGEYQEHDVRNSLQDVNKLENLVNIDFKNLDEGVQETLKFYRGID